MVMERVGQVEATWQRARTREPEAALEEALMRLALVQGALRRRLLDRERRKLMLNRHDPIGRGIDFSHLDAMVDELWGESG